VVRGMFFIAVAHEGQHPSPGDDENSPGVFLTQPIHPTHLTHPPYSPIFMEEE
jgi:hypothetical protein